MGALIMGIVDTQDDDNAPVLGLDSKDIVIPSNVINSTNAGKMEPSEDSSVCVAAVDLDEGSFTVAVRNTILNPIANNNSIPPETLPIES